MGFAGHWGCAVGHLGQNINQGLGGICVFQHFGHCADTKAGAAKGFQFKSNLGQCLATEACLPIDVGATCGGCHKPDHTAAELRPLGVTHYGIWNEPNLDGFFEGTVQEYVDTILLPGAAAVRTGCQAAGYDDCLVLGPDLAHVGEADDYLEELLSLAKHRPIDRPLAMTGELTLTGQVFPVGGIREKVIAARRAGIRELILPIDNRGDYDEIPEHIRKGFKVHFAEQYGDVASILFPARKR